MKRLWELNGAAEILPPDLRQVLDRLDIRWEPLAEELRLRRGYSMTVNVGVKEIATDSACVTEEHLRSVLENASQASVHTVVNQIAQGFVTLKGGHRIGLCGTVTQQGDKLINLRHLNSVSIRIARPVCGVSKAVLPKLVEEGRFQSTLILAPPGVGKTTLLRDLIRELSDEGVRVAVVDERGEIAALWDGEPQFEIGSHTDILDGCRKGEGMSILLRGMNPQVMAVDEITQEEDVRTVADVCGCGVALLATAHGASRKDLRRRPVYRMLMDEHVFRRLVIMERIGERRCMRVEVLE